MRFDPKIFIDTRRSEYVTSLDDAWATETYDVASTSPKLKEYVFNLLLAWRSADYTARLPAILIEVLGGFYRGHVSALYENQVVMHMTETIRDRIIKEVPELQTNSVLARKIHEQMMIIAARARDAHESFSAEFPAEDTWKQLLESEAYGLSVWSAQRVTYLIV